MGMTVVFIWVPAHFGIIANEMSDNAAKEVLSYIILATVILVRLSKAETTEYHRGGRKNGKKIEKDGGLTICIEKWEK